MLRCVAQFDVAPIILAGAAVTSVKGLLGDGMESASSGTDITASTDWLQYSQMSLH